MKFHFFLVGLLVIHLLPRSIVASDIEPMPMPTPPQPSTSTALSNATPDEEKGYRIYPGDLMKVDVFDQPDLTIQLHIPPNGQITFPLIGEVKGLIGRTVEDLGQELKRRLEDGYIPTAIVTISFLKFGQRSASVMGCVHNPMAINLDPFSPTTVLQAISQAGGFADGANRLGAHIVRNKRDAAGGKIIIAIPASDEAKEMKKDIQLEPDDIVIVPRLDRIFILGQVKKPGAVDLPSSEELTVSKAISIAGGFERFGRQSEVQVIRNGVTIKVVDVRAALNGAKTDDPKLLPGDTIFVPETRF